MANGKRSDANKIEITERRQRALRLRRNGNSYRDIASALGGTPSQAFYDVQHELKKLNRQNNKQAHLLRDMEGERLEMAMRAIIEPVQNGNLEAVRTWVKLSESYRKLYGIDAPTVTIVYQAQLEKLVSALEEKGIDPAATFEAMLNELADTSDTRTTHA